MTGISWADNAVAYTSAWEIAYWLPAPHHRWQFICTCSTSFACRLLERLEQRQPQTQLRLRLVHDSRERLTSAPHLVNHWPASDQRVSKELMESWRFLSQVRIKP